MGELMPELALDLTCTTDEAARMLGVQPATIRKLVQRGKLKPIQAGAHPMRFHEPDIWRRQQVMLTPEQRQQLSDAWDEVEAILKAKRG